MARKSALALLALTAALLLERCQTDEKVSFYGASYIHLSVQEAKSATDISFRFRTHLADAMLLLAAGRTDYCLIKLESGTLKVHINLGAGEKVLESARELILNDLSWHEVNLTRRDANITLKIDVIHSVSDVLPGRFFELNINFGVYIGGQGSFNELFLGHTEYLRGCMANIMYNGLTVIEHARRRNSTEATAVSWGCSAEFDASPRAEISFVEDGAFTAIPRAIPRSGSSWELELKTVSPVGLLLFNAGQSSHADFLGVELVDGKIRLLMNKGNGPTELIHNRPVADGLWHEVQLNFTPSFVGISVDGQTRNLSLPSGNRYLDLADTLYIGGTELNKRAKALSKGIKSGDVSYKGCLKNMMLDGKELGLPNVKVSQGLVVNCVWGFPCAEAVPCVPGAICSQLGVGSFKCTCDQTLCIKSNFTEEYKFNTNLPVSLEVLAVRPLEVAEGRRAVITERNIALVLDVAKYGLNESHLVFALLTPPVHGSLQLERVNLAPKTPFNLYDIHQMKISYLHDGSETTEDSMILKVALQASSRHALPGYFQDSLRFTLHISITPVNDPPRLEVAFNATLKLAQGTRKTLTRDIIWAVDADTPAESLVYSVLPNDNDVGHVERTTVSGGGGEPQQQLVHTFTQAELAHGSIDYVHSGKNKTKAVLALKVSDGEASSMPVFLHIETYPLSIELKQNTGLVVVHRSFSYLTPANLSFTTNAKDSRIEIRYNIVRPPQYGILQRQKDYMLPWTNTDHFTSRDLEQQAVRYLHNVGSPFQDNFKFKARVREVQSPMTYDFNITFIILELVEVHRSVIDFTNSARVVIDSRKIKFQTNPLLTESNLIIYSLLESPRYGHVYLEEERLRIGQMFSQHDIDLGRLHYRHFRRAFSIVEDSILFKVTAPQCSDVTTSLSFRYQPAKSANLPQSIESIRVVEGERALVKLTRINYHDFDVSALGFNVTDLPRHGCLTIYNKSVPLRVNTTYFTSEELASHLVYYVHDDSETSDDTFQFLAMSTDDADFMYIGVFHISIELRNDNPPKRINSHIFHVVSGGEKPITRADLLYADEDQHTKPSDIVYTVKQLNGMLFRVDDPLYQVNQFTQQDIDEERIVYKHRGNKYERIDFTVSDGELVTNGELEIQAGQAYVKLLLHDGCIVQSNRSVVLSPHDIDIETNVNANPSEVIFSVMEGPKYGIILKHGRVVSSFDRNDLQRKAVSYKHVGITLKKDQFRLKVNAKGAEDSDALTIKVLPENYWQPLIVRTNNTVYVEEATSVIMNRKSLDIGYPGIPENRIVYHIRQWPRNGYLEVQSHEEILETESDDDFSTHLVKHFEQSLVNEGRVYYVQSTPNQTHDRFIVDVTNGITWLRNLSINIVIMPDKLYMDSRNLTVDEGKSVIFQDSNFYAVTSYFAGKITDYRVIEKPKHGTIVDTRNNPIRNFTHKQLASQKVLYKNNGDEVTEDYFKMVVVAGEKSSESFKVWINVRPINDEVPALVNKTHFNIWQGGSVLITRDLLAAIDNDTQPVDLMFNIKSVANGYFSLVELPKIGIHNFSQEMINTFKVLFTHTNGSEAEFRFTVSDGLHTTEAFWVSLDTKPIQIMMERNRLLKVFPLARKPITSDLLLAKCSDPGRDVEYIVTNAPSMGKIIMESSEGNWLEVDRFTQKDLNNSKVSYEHNRQFNNLSASDSFNFDVKTHFAAPIKNEIFKIDISVSSGGLHRFVSVTPVRVEEGGSSPFSLNVSGIIHFLRTKVAIFKPEVSARLIRKPEHGHVMLLPDVNLTTYSQGEIESGQIAYFHDHSDTLKDEIDFTLYFSPGHIALCNVSVPVDIVPINDQPFKLEVTKDIDIVQNQTQTITRDNLLTTDPDTGPENIVYEIITAPTYGRLILLSGDRIIGSDLQSTKKFTQLDIDSSRLVYEHQGPLLVSTFYFRVSDGYFQHEYKFFKINVHPIKLNMTILKPVEIQQGQSWTSVDTDSLHLETNVRHELVTYEVTRPPEHGRLHAREQTSRFRHTDLLSKSVIYEQQDMSVSADSFELTARVSEFELRNIHIPIRAVPLMILGTGMEVFAGDRTKLTIKHFDATPLAKLAKINPTIRITRKPKYAKVMRIMNRTMSSGEKRGVQEKETNTFSHSHVLSGVIYLVCKKVPSDDILGVQDNFGFTLTADQNPPRFQPAASTFNFRVRLGSDYYNNSLDGPMDPVGHEGEMAIAPNMSNDYTLLLGMLLGVFFLGICVIVTIRCRQSRYKDPDDEDDEEDDGHEDKVEPSSPSVMPLPRPPDHLLPATPHLKRYTANDHHNNSLSSSTPLPPMMPSLTSTLPQCKVIPLSPMENIAGSEMDVSARYPYGVADGDEWSSFDTTELPCPSQTSQPRSTTNASNNPLLRRNQYWV